MQETDMAVVVSSEQNEIEKFKAKGLDIKRHRQRMVGEDLEERFKDPADSFRLVFVRAMWMTGFDVPNCSTIYLDKPMRNHTLMQTIARANRVFGEKNNGLIVDYIGVFRNLQEALAIYAAGRGEADTGEVDTPVKDKQALLDELAQALDEADAFCAEHGVDLDLIAAEQDVFKRIALKAQAEDALLVNDEAKTEFLSHAAYTTKLYKAILPDKAARQYQAKASVLGYLSLQIRSRDPGVDISAILAEVEAVLDKSITPTDYFIRAAIETPVEEESVSDERAPYHVGDSPERLDLRRLDFDALAEQFKTGHRHTELEKLRGAINQKLNGMIRLNRQRMNYREQFEKLITEYNSGSANVVQVYNELLALVKALNEEERRHVAEGLSEEELALFDLLIHKPEMELSKKERQAVKKAAHELLLKLKGGLLTLDWRQHQQAQAQVRIAINDTLDELLPAAFDAELYETKCEMVYQHVFENYFGEDRSTYESLPLGV
ncbi:MAG: type I restriction endonuclease subunit R [Anaerolineae bacterium]|nr:type I restriction endonuclease subunit R [Anaerolineae bacterium]